MHTVLTCVSCASNLALKVRQARKRLFSPFLPQYLKRTEDISAMNKFSHLSIPLSNAATLSSFIESAMFLVFNRDNFGLHIYGARRQLPKNQRMRKKLEQPHS